MKMKRYPMAISLAVGLTLGLSATPAYTVQTHTLKLAVGAEPSEGFDPLLGWSHGSYVLLHAPLLRQHADLTFHPLLAESYSLSDDDMTWTIRLKPDLRFSDGSPLTADDVVFSYNQAAVSGGKADMGSFSHAKAIDERTLAITLKRPESTFINVLGALGIVPKAKYGKNFAQSPVGAGPYKLSSLQPGQQLIVEANPYYAGEKNDFEKLIFVFLDQDSAFAAAGRGDLDLVRIPPTLASQTVPSMKLLIQKSVENRGIMFPMVPPGKKDAQGNDVGNSVTADPAVRQAINYAVDRELLASQLLDGQAHPAFTAVDGLPWDNSEAKFKDADIDKAKQLLEQAGWIAKTPGGIREKNGIPAKITLWYASGDSTRRDLAQAFSAMMKPLGIEVSLKSGSWETVEQHMHANPTLFGWGSLDPMELYHHYASRLGGEGYFNPGYYANSTVDEHLRKAIEAPNWKAAIPHWQKVDWDGKTGAGVRGDAAWVWLLNINHTYLVNPCVSLGEGAPEAHGDWTVLNNLDGWRWTCQ